MTELNLDHIEALARETGTGPDDWYDESVIMDGAEYKCDARFIAAASPAVVLALVERLRKAEAVRQITPEQKWQNWEHLQAEIAAGRVHADADVEQKWAERERDQNCPACGGSGHVDDATSSAAMDVLAERRRQIEAKGWTPEHDDSHNHGELAHAAGVLALADVKLFLRGAIEYWPWDAPSMETDIIGTSYRTRLIKAAALLLAEIERTDRAAAKQAEDKK